MLFPRPSKGVSSTASSPGASSTCYSASAREQEWKENERGNQVQTGSTKSRPARTRRSDPGGGAAAGCVR